MNHFQVEMTNIVQLLGCEDLLLFLVLSDNKLHIFGLQETVIGFQYSPISTSQWKYLAL